MRKATLGSRIRLLMMLGAYLMLAAVVIGPLLANIRPFALWCGQEGVPMIVREQSGTVRSEIIQVLCDGERLYLLHRNGVVQAYSSEGDYQFAAGFYAHPNGRFGMALVDGELVVRDRVGNLYYFIGDDFERYVSRQETEAGPGQLNWNRSTAGYEIRGSSVWHSPAGQEARCIIEGSGISGLFHGRGAVFLTVGAVAMIGTVLYWPKKREERGSV